ncbi:MAG: molybdopterin molybdenumtransferase MoeA [Candidatus Lokiarchaeota archaeon]|nr:molybdopterin molybdenumtransferase MoeA [Candidatus Lokiarchaeota archaeon]
MERFRTLLKELPQLELGTEQVDLEQSFNRKIAEDVKSPINVPHFRKSRMDGFAVRAQDTFRAEEDNLIPLTQIEVIEAGDIPQKSLKEEQCAYVATGAAIPEGADAVVMVEYSEKEDDKILISKAVTPTTHIVEIGHDVRRGDIIIEKDTLIDLPTMGILAACGITTVQVYKKPEISLMSTGSELVTHEVSELEIGQIYDINSIILKQAISNTGSKVNYLGIVKDNFDELKHKIEQGFSQSDVVILSGGTSKGEGDLGVRVLDTFENIEVQVHGIKIKPGKPLIFAKLQNKMIFILPGYPTSALSCFYVFIDDYLRRLSGFPLRTKNTEELELGERIYSPIGRYHFKAVELREVDGVRKIFPIKTGSEAISTLFYSDGYIEIEELEEIVEKGDKKVFYTY